MAIDKFHVWIGSFESRERWEDYLREDDPYGGDERPISQFASDQGVTFYDHDQIEGGFVDETASRPIETRIDELLSNLSCEPGYIDTVVAAAARPPVLEANAIIGMRVDEIPDPRSVVGTNYELRYVGTYEPPLPSLRFDRAATELNLRDRGLTEIPLEVFELEDLVELSVANNMLTVIPSQIRKLRNLEVLYVYENRLTALPDELFGLPKLRKIKANHNLLQSLPTAIGAAAGLVTLTLSKNVIRQLPPEIGELERLEFLDVAANELTELPPAIGRLDQLETLRIDGNEISVLPDEITALHSLRTLKLPRQFDLESQTPGTKAWLVDIS